MVMVFVLGLFFDPPYRFAPEDNLTYKDFVDLHYEAAKFLERHEQNSTILTAWPASDELTRTPVDIAQLVNDRHVEVAFVPHWSLSSNTSAPA